MGLRKLSSLTFPRRAWCMQENLQNELVSQLYKDSSMADMMRETPDVARRRSEIQEMRTLLQKALEIVNEVRDFSSFAPGGK